MVEKHPGHAAAMACDVVVQLDEHLCLTQDAPQLAAMFFRRPATWMTWAWVTSINQTIGDGQLVPPVNTEPFGRHTNWEGPGTNLLIYIGKC